MKSIRVFQNLLACSFLIGSGVVGIPAQAFSPITWNLDNVFPFEFGDRAEGYFTIDEKLQIVDWNIKLTGGSNPIFQNITFRLGDNCLISSAGLIPRRLRRKIEK